MKKSLFASVCVVGLAVSGSSQAFRGKVPQDKANKTAANVHNIYGSGRSPLKKLMVIVHGEGGEGANQKVVTGRHGEIDDVTRSISRPFTEAATNKATSSADAILSQDLNTQEQVRDVLVNFLVENGLDHLTATLSDGNPAPFPVFHVFRNEKSKLTGNQSIGASVGTEKEVVYGWTHDSSGKVLVGQDLSNQAAEPTPQQIKIAPSIRQ